jgi:hypothetical protein
MKFQTTIFVAALFATADATPRRLRKGELRRTQAEETPAVEKGNEVGAEAEEVMVKAKSLKSMSMDGGSPRVVDAKAEKVHSMNLSDGGSMKAKAEKVSAGAVGSMRFVDSSMKAKAEKIASDGVSMRTIDAKAEKTGSMRLFEGSMKAKAEKASGGGSMRLVDSSMKAKAEKTTAVGV